MPVSSPTLNLRAGVVILILTKRSGIRKLNICIALVLMTR